MRSESVFLRSEENTIPENKELEESRGIVKIQVIDSGKKSLFIQRNWNIKR